MVQAVPQFNRNVIGGIQIIFPTVKLLLLSHITIVFAEMNPETAHLAVAIDDKNVH